MHHDVASRNIRHAKKSAGALRRTKCHKVAQVEHVGRNGKSPRKAYVADDAARTSAALIANAARRFNCCVTSNGEREVGCLTDKTTAGSLAFDAKARKVNAVVNGNGRAIATDADEATGACTVLGRLDSRVPTVSARKR